MAVEKARRTRKSRAGCRNCKLRKVKCDEARPWCGKCEAYGVVCNYQKAVPDLQVASEQGDPWTMETLRRASHGETGIAPTGSSSVYLSTPLRTPLISADEASSLHLDALSVEFLNRFRHYTACTLGGPAMQEVCDSHIMQLAFSSPLLMHAALALASSHDRFLRSPRLTKRSSSETHHWAEGTALFNRKLRSPIRPQDRDLLWATAINLGVVDFASLDASNPEEAWPMRLEPDPSDLRWIRMSAGKKAMWEATNPLRPGSIFGPVAADYTRLHAPLPTSGVRNVPPVLRQLCGIDEASTAGNNPYYMAVQALASLASLPRDKVSPVAALGFITHVNPDYGALLEQKDAVALLLLALWYAGAARCVWWIERRAEVEGRSICLYLERYHWYKDRILDILPWRSPVSFDDVWGAPNVFDDRGFMAEPGQLDAWQWASGSRIIGQ